MLREAEIKVPVMDNDGVSLSEVKVKTEKELLDKFGGFSLHNTFGGWIDAATGKIHKEEILSYTIAMEPGTDNDFALIDIAKMVKFEARQKAVYVRFADGNVQMI